MCNHVWLLCVWLCSLHLAAVVQARAVAAAAAAATAIAPLAVAVLPPACVRMHQSLQATGPAAHNSAAKEAGISRDASEPALAAKCTLHSYDHSWLIENCMTPAQLCNDRFIPAASDQSTACSIDGVPSAAARCAPLQNPFGELQPLAVCSYLQWVLRVYLVYLHELDYLSRAQAVQRIRLTYNSISSNARHQACTMPVSCCVVATAFTAVSASSYLHKTVTQPSWLQ
jgi:hypothetical protein